MVKEEEVDVKQVALFDRLRPQIATLLDELKELSKKKADAAMSKFKVNLVNEKLKEANSLLGAEDRPFQNFELLDVDNVPTTSDAVIVLSQYLEALETWRSARIFWQEDVGEWYWNIPEENIWVKTRPPRRARIEQPQADDDADGEEN